MFLFGLPGSNNDLNVLDSSPLIHNMLTSEALGGMLDGWTLENENLLLTN